MYMYMPFVLSVKKVQKNWWDNVLVNTRNVPVLGISFIHSSADQFANSLCEIQCDYLPHQN